MITIKNQCKIFSRYLLSMLGKDVFYPLDIKQIKKEHYGSNYGGYVIHPDAINSESIVYSFGLGNDISFDLEVIQNHGCQVYAYDPSPETNIFLSSQNLPTNFIFHKVGLGSTDGVLQFYPSPNPGINYSVVKKLRTGGAIIELSVSRLSTILQNNNHKKIDLLKIDIEGAEFDVLKDIISSNIEICQLVIEFHHKHKEFSHNGISMLKETILLLKENGFKIFNISSGGIEYSFIKLS